MDELLERYAKRLDNMVEGGTYQAPYSGLGLLADFARSVIELQAVTGED